MGGLDAELDPQKPAISKGQMQLLCLARAILRDAPILVLDESNASVDAETDAMMEVGCGGRRARLLLGVEQRPRAFHLHALIVMPTAIALLPPPPNRILWLGSRRGGRA